MEYTAKQFTPQLEKHIHTVESSIQELLISIYEQYKQAFEKKDLQLSISVIHEGENPFKPGYHATIQVGILEKDEFLDVLFIPIWHCVRTFLGIRSSRRLPGSKITGELMEETEEEIKKEVVAYLKQQLED
ncbi:hypothetical protein C2I27_08150 [Priestia megaterium]|uniref:hypothetical protein n=1 Tax=Priestia TaxID=2800373 RepID=UPI000D5093E4|nr:hypothetical protein [Priestia megaterium]MBU8852092.1 hypothetical protein [Bacillus sp. FJAT-26377]PVC72328.1 hypothetical protein C2I27_08150 [Priestia megaterium]